MQAVVDIVDLATPGNVLEQGTHMTVILPPTEDIFPYGSGVNFIPIRGSNKNGWRAMITLSRGEKDPAVGGSVLIEGSKGPNGNRIKRADWSGTELSDNQMLYGIASLGMSALSRIEES